VTADVERTDADNTTVPAPVVSLESIARRRTWISVSGGGRNVELDAGAAGFFTIYPCGSDRPEASTLNFAAGQTIANGATIKLGTGSTICVYTDQATDLLLDVTGFVPAT